MWTHCFPTAPGRFSSSALEKVSGRELAFSRETEQRQGAAVFSPPGIQPSQHLSQGVWLIICSVWDKDSRRQGSVSPSPAQPNVTGRCWDLFSGKRLQQIQSSQEEQQIPGAIGKRKQILCLFGSFCYAGWKKQKPPKRKGHCAWLVWWDASAGRQQDLWGKGEMAPNGRTSGKY